MKIVVDGIYQTEGRLGLSGGGRWFSGFDCIISIVDPRGASPFCKSKFPNLIVLEMYDLDDEDLVLCKKENWPEAAHAPTLEVVKEVVGVAVNHGIDSSLYVHCHMGYSRSPAVAAIWSYVAWQNDAEKAIQDAQAFSMGRVEPNRRILRLADEVLGCPRGSLLDAEIKRMSNLTDDLDDKLYIPSL